MTFPELTKIISKYLMLSDYSAVRFLAAVVIANRIPMLDPTFAFLVSNSSGGKSELLMTLSKTVGVDYLDDLSAKTFASGARKAGVETSYLFNLPKDPICVMTDFTLMLDKNEEEAKQIMSQLRLIYDGKFKKRFGTGDQVSWTGRLGFLAGVTTAVYEKEEQYAALGPRMINYHMEQGDAEAVTIFSLKNAHRMKAGREEMAEAMHEFIDTVSIPIELIEFPDDQFLSLVKLANMASLSRSAVSRQKYHRDNPINMVHAREMPMRIAKQLMNLGQAMAAMNGGVLTDEDFNILFKVALDTIPLMRKRVMVGMTEYEKADVNGLSAHLGLEFNTVKKIVDDLAALKVIRKTEGFGKGNYFYHLDYQWRELVSQFEHIQMTGQVLTEKEKTVDQPMPEEIYI